MSHVIKGLVEAALKSEGPSIPLFSIALNILFHQDTH
jgi:hypothetical protein